MAGNDQSVGGLLRAYDEGHLSRRDVLQRAALLGVSASAVGSLLATAGPAAAASRASAATTPRRGGTLIEGYDRPFSPITTVNAAWVDPTQDALLEGLVSADPTGKLVPKIAESWKVSKDAKVWTFTIRKGLRFHSGAPVTVAKVVEDLNLDRGKAGQHPYWYSQVVSIKAGPGNTVVVRCNKPFASLGELYRQQFSNIYNAATAKKNPKGYGTRVVDGTGPFQLTSFVADKAVTAKRFEKYAGSVVPWYKNKGKAYLDGIKWVPIVEAANRGNEVASGGVHVTKNPLPSDIAGLKANKDLVVIEQEEAGGLVFGLNFEKLGFADLRVRQAISHAIDRQAIVKAILQGHGTATFGPFPTSYKWYDKGVEKFNQFDTAKAESLLDAAGWVKGSGGTRAKAGQELSFTIVNQTDTVRNQVGDAVVQMLSKIGVKATMQNLEPGAYFQALGGGADAYFFPWIWASFPRIAQVLSASQFIPAPNWAHAKVDAVDAAMDLWSFAANDKQLEAAARKIQLVCAENLPVMTLYVPHVVWVHSKKLQGFTPTNPTNFYPFYNDMWLSK